MTEFERKYNLIDEIDKVKLDTVEKIIELKIDVMTSIRVDDYVKNYDTILKIEEDCMKLIYNYTDMKRHYKKVVNK